MRQQAAQAYAPQSMPFVGRERELADLQAMVANPACRLVTLTGPGGIGKTRLAVEVVARVAPMFPDGIVFVALEASTPGDALIATITRAVDVPLAGQLDPRKQLVRALQNKAILLVLDNFEHLVDDAELLVELLSSAPRLMLLVTSRETLNLHEEWVYRLQGLDVPSDTATPESTPSSSLQLFVERAQRVRHDFSLEHEIEAVIRICQLTEGVPLALELAAAWVRTLSCTAIATELAGSVAFLETRLRNVPERHRSVRATFDYSWRLLSEQQRIVFARLAVFQRGFTRKAAERVATADLAILATLLDKSLLRIDEHGRYHIHELLRQFALEQLGLSADELRRVRDQHCVYYAELLHSYVEDVAGERQREAMASIVPEIGNALAAWQHALAHLRLAEIERAADTLFYFFHRQSRYHEGVALFAEAVHRLEQAEATRQHSLILARVLVWYGWLCLRLGHLQTAEATLHRSQELVQRFDAVLFGADPLPVLGIVVCVHGDFAEAARLGEVARQRSEAGNDVRSRMLAYYLLTAVAIDQGNYAVAQQYAQETYTIATALRDRWFTAYVLIDLGKVALALGEAGKAEHSYQASYAIREAFGDGEGVAVALVHLGDVALAQNNYRAAHERYQRGLQIYEEIGSPAGRVRALLGLGQTWGSTNQLSHAARALAQALQLASDIRFTAAMLIVLTSIAELLLETKCDMWGPELLVMVLQHPASVYTTSERAQQLLLRYEAALAPDVFAAATRRGQNTTLETLVPHMLRVLEELETTSVTALSHAESADVAPARPGSFIFDVEAHELVIDGQRVGLSHLEFRVLRYLSERTGKAVPRGDLLEDVWGYSYDGGSNVVDVVVRALRKKLGAHAGVIETVTKVGYRYRQ